MPAKLRYGSPTNPLSFPAPTRGWLGRPLPHLLYANLKFGTPSAKKDLDRLWDWFKGFAGLGRRWSKERINRYLEEHQGEFVRCLDWLSKSSKIDVDPDGKDSSPDGTWGGKMLKKWERQPEVTFLQRHGFGHAGVMLQPVWQMGSIFSEIELDQGKPQDPLDRICWYLLSRLMWDKTVGVRRCKYAKCGKFFQPPTPRRFFHTDNCRARDHADKLPVETKRENMRKWRERREKARRVKNRNKYLEKGRQFSGDGRR